MTDTLLFFILGVACGMLIEICLYLLISIIGGRE